MIPNCHGIFKTAVGFTGVNVKKNSANMKNGLMRIVKEEGNIRFAILADLKEMSILLNILGQIRIIIN